MLLILLCRSNTFLKIDDAVFTSFFVAKQLFNYKCPSICQVLRKTRFSPSLFKIEVQFFVCRFPLHMSICSINILSIGLSRAFILVFFLQISNKGVYPTPPRLKPLEGKGMNVPPPPEQIDKSISKLYLGVIF